MNKSILRQKLFVLIGTGFLVGKSEEENLAEVGYTREKIDLKLLSSCSRTKIFMNKL